LNTNKSEVQEHAGTRKLYLSHFQFHVQAYAHAYSSLCTNRNCVQYTFHKELSSFTLSMHHTMARTDNCGYHYDYIYMFSFILLIVNGPLSYLPAK